MGGGSIGSSPQSTSDMLGALIKYGPDAIRALTNVGPYVAQTEQDINKSIQPQEAALETQIYGDYGPKLNEIGSQINRQNQLASTALQNEITSGPGKQLVTNADALQRQLDPEYYSNRATIGNAVNELFSGMSPNTLTPTELEQINRGISARQGAVPDSALSTIRNAQTFGNAIQQKQQNFGNAISSASSALPALRSGISGIDVALGRPSPSNTGDTRLSSSPVVNPTSALDQNFGFANNILSQIGSNQRQAIARTNTTAQDVGLGISAAGALGSLAGGVF